MEIGREACEIDERDLAIAVEITFLPEAGLIEMGFLLAYRTGWRISIAAVATNAAAALVLIPIGLLVFKDHLSLKNVVGLVFCLVGLALLMRQ